MAELTFDRFSDCELGVIKGISGVSRIEQGNKQLLDPLCHGNTKGVQIVCYGVNSIQQRGPRGCARNFDLALLQAVLHDLDQILILRFTAELPCLQLLIQRAHPERAEDSAPL